MKNKYGIEICLDITEDILADEKGECVICLEDLQPGDVIARLPCLCIYHKKLVFIFFILFINNKFRKYRE